VLVVEDDASVMEFLRGLLLDGSYEVLQARNGIEAMVALTAPRDELPHAILLDLGLPVESGLSVLRFLRYVMKSRLPVIIITGRSDPDEERAVHELGVSAYLRKPAGARQVLDALSAALA
jgi:DNA-binding response OmpR family regulator